MSQTDAVRCEECWIVVPTFNEAGALGEVLHSLVNTGYTVVCVDDGSQDETAEIAAGHPVHLVRHAINLGQGAALQTGMEYALNHGARYLISFDADGQHAVEDIPKLLNPLRQGECDVTLGTRFRHQLHSANVPRPRRLALKLAAKLTRLKTGLEITDTHNGLRGFTAEAAGRIEIKNNGMAHATEILEIIAWEQLRVREVDVSIRYTAYSMAKGQKLTNSLNIIWEWLFGKVR